jgi:membrane protease YdiL (CAAX protease family)
MVLPTKKTAVFLALTFSFSAILYVLIFSSKSIQGYSLYLMWCPGLAALLTQLIFTKSFRDLGWRLGSARYLLIGFTLPFAYTLVLYCAVWAVGIGPCVLEDYARFIAPQLPFQVQSPGMTVLLGIGYVSTVGVLTTGWATLGEELGWRGLLVPELAKRYSFTATSLISGVIWAAWHVPVLLCADYNNAGAPLWFGLMCFTVLVCGISFAFAWMRIKSGSIWAIVLFHASHNIAIQGVFTPMTGSTSLTPYVIDEFGIGLALVAVLVGFAFARDFRRHPHVGTSSPT